MPSQMNICGQSLRTAAMSAKSAQAAPDAVKIWTAKAAVVNCGAVAGLADGSLGFNGSLGVIS